MALSVATVESWLSELQEVLPKLQSIGAAVDDAVAVAEEFPLPAEVKADLEKVPAWVSEGEKAVAALEAVVSKL